MHAAAANEWTYIILEEQWEINLLFEGHERLILLLLATDEKSDLCQQLADYLLGKLGKLALTKRIEVEEEAIWILENFLIHIR